MPRPPERVEGLSRAAIYLAAKEGHVVIKKLGRTSLVDIESVRRYIDSLPVAKIGA